MSNAVTIYWDSDINYGPPATEYKAQEEFPFTLNTVKRWCGSFDLYTPFLPLVSTIQQPEYRPNYSLIPKAEDAYPKPRISFEDVFAANGIPNLGELRASDIAALFQTRPAIIGFSSTPQQNASTGEFTENDVPLVRARCINGRWVGADIKLSPETIAAAVRADRDER